MTDEPLFAEVLNGTVGTGDTIAYPNRFASSLDMRIATILEVIEKPHAWKTGETTKALKVEVTEASDRGFVNVPYTTTIGVLNRVVKLSDSA